VRDWINYYTRFPYNHSCNHRFTIIWPKFSNFTTEHFPRPETTTDT